MIEFETEVLEVIPRARNVKSFRFKSNEDVNFKPGQFFFVTIRNNGKDLTKHFSFSNSPTEKEYIEFTKKLTGSDYSEALDKLKPGDWAILKLPNGAFTFEGEHKKIALLTGGIGITPFRSICQFVTDKNLTTDIVLLYGNNTEEDIIFREDFDRMAKKYNNLRVVYTLASPDIDRSTWKGRTGLISSKMIKEEIPDFGERVFYYCGPPKMVEYLGRILKDELSIPDSRLIKENFPGY